MQKPSRRSFVFSLIALVLIFVSGLDIMNPTLHFLALLGITFASLNHIHDGLRGYMVGFLLGVLWTPCAMMQFSMAIQ
mgnify:CR=1